MPNPRLISTETVYAGRLFNVLLDTIEMDGGVVARREILRHPGAVCMVPVDGDGNLVLVTQYRHAAGRRFEAAVEHAGGRQLRQAGRRVDRA